MTDFSCFAVPQAVAFIRKTVARNCFACFDIRLSNSNDIFIGNTVFKNILIITAKDVTVFVKANNTVQNKSSICSFVKCNIVFFQGQGRLNKHNRVFSVSEHGKHTNAGSCEMKSTAVLNDFVKNRKYLAHRHNFFSCRDKNHPLSVHALIGNKSSFIVHITSKAINF